MILKDAFQKSNPEIWKEFQGDVKKIEEARRIQDRTFNLKHDCADHALKYRNHWIAQETNRIWLETYGKQKPEFKPGWANGMISLTQEAQRRVDQRLMQRLARIERAEGNMLQKLTRTEKPTFSTLEKDVLNVVARTRQIRIKAAVHFKTHRAEWLRQAEYAEFEKPEAVIGKRYVERLKRIDRAQENLIRQTFQKHGQEIPLPRLNTPRQELDMK